MKATWPRLACVYCGSRIVPSPAWGARSPRLFACAKHASLVQSDPQYAAQAREGTGAS